MRKAIFAIVVAVCFAQEGHEEEHDPEDHRHMEELDEMDHPIPEGHTAENEAMAAEVRKMMDEMKDLEEEYDNYKCPEVFAKFEEDNVPLTEKEKETLELCDGLNEKIDKIDTILEDTGAYEHFREDAEEEWDMSDDDDFGDEPEEEGEEYGDQGESEQVEL